MYEVARYDKEIIVLLNLYDYAAVDIRNVSKTLKVERVNLQPLLVEISFLVSTMCGCIRS